MEGDHMLTFNSIGGEEADVASFQGVLMGEFSCSGLGFRLSSQ